MLLRVPSLPDDPPAAAAAFHAEVLPKILAGVAEGAQTVTLVFAPAAHAHRAWREAAVQTLAAARSPARINALCLPEGADPAHAEAAVASAMRYVAAAPGLTGQYLILDGTGAGAVIPSGE